MRPKRISYTLAALSVSGYVSGATGVGPFTTIAGVPADGLGHQVTLASTADLHLINMTLTGLDAEGRALTEVIAGPNNNTVTSTKYFKSLSSISAASTLGANTMNIGWNAVIVTPVYPVDAHRLAGATMNVNVGGTITFTLQQTIDDVFNQNPPFYTTLGTVSQTANYVQTAVSGACGLRVSVASHTSGILTISFSQGM
jgi:hypothetical protein